ncbi:hypothetical protein HCA58_22755 [Micromonospora sp. HNM0581]|uniref:hypothetical protein n=1 Tax=Micromonospora sp. HNM0581 TaxID=2716341 RepID=UPI00146DB156|nr:hypothetical protein [Micromonospora sp. HNM0581]NLU81109.1 hypothetical protein [Micromonospora sp. HNM0581]
MQLDVFPLPQMFFALALWLAGQAVLYFVIRMAVRHAIEDADRRRASQQRG